MDNQITRELLIIKSFQIYQSDNYYFKDLIIKIKGIYLLEHELKIPPGTIPGLKDP